LPLKLALVFLGGGIGSTLRFLVGYWTVQHLAPASRWPWGTFAVNLVGCLLIGAAGGYALGRLFVDDAYRTFAVIGLLGGMTTFSSFGFEAFALYRGGHAGLAGGYVVASVVLGLAAVWAGYQLAR
jgi:CrcB protein